MRTISIVLVISRSAIVNKNNDYSRVINISHVHQKLRQAIPLNGSSFCYVSIYYNGLVRIETDTRKNAIFHGIDGRLLSENVPTVLAKEEERIVFNVRPDVIVSLFVYGC